MERERERERELQSYAINIMITFLKYYVNTKRFIMGATFICIKKRIKK